MFSHHKNNLLIYKGLPHNELELYYHSSDAYMNDKTAGLVGFNS